MGLCLGALAATVSLKSVQAGPDLVTVDLLVNDADSGFTLRAHKSVAPGANAFAVMTNIVRVTYRNFGGEPFVKSIGGVTPESGKYWALHVGGIYSTNLGINNIIITNDTSIEWKTEK